MDSRAHRPHGSSQSLRWALLPLALALGLLASHFALAAPRLQPFHIDAGDAALTLNEFSRQSSLQLLFDYNIVRGRKTRAISGELEASAALQDMLTDTGLTFDFVNERTLAVTLRSYPSAGSAMADAINRTRHIQSTVTQSVTHGGPGSADLPAEARPPTLEEVRVLGTLVRGEGPVGEHVLQLDREDINGDPAATVQDLLRTLPQIFGGGPTEDTHFFSAETATNSGIGSGINLRGLGARATLVLMDGKRLAPSGTQGQFEDIENIPLSAVERVDILSYGASALYGSDAVGGVVNFVMRDNFSGAETLARTGSGVQGTMEEHRVAQTLGSHWDSGNVMLSLEFYKRAALPAGTRPYLTSDLRPLGGSNFDTPMSNPGTLIAGGQSYALPANPSGARLNAGELAPGTQNLSDWQQGNDILPSQSRWSLYSSAKQSINDNITLYGNALASRREAQVSAGGLKDAISITSANPFYINPTGGNDPVTLDYNFQDDIGPLDYDVAVTNLNMTLGAQIAVGTGWRLNLYANYAQERENQLTTGAVNVDTVQAALADPNPATAFNPFAPASQNNPATLRSLATSERFYVNSKLQTADIAADGPITRLPGGELKIAFGVDRRHESFGTLQPADPNLPQIATDASRNVTAAFTELRIPLFGKENERHGLRRLELSIAGRYENYDDFGHAAVPKLGAMWAPLAGLAFRSSWGRSIRAPTLSDLNVSGNVVVVPYVLPDNHSPTGFSSVLLQGGNSPNLTVENARTWTAGFDIDTRDWGSGLVFSATYFDVRYQNRIEAPVLDMNVLNEPAFADLVTRNPNAAQFAAACGSGQNVSGTTSECVQSGVNVILDDRTRNRQSLRTRGIDLSSSYEHRWSPGMLKLRLDGTYLLDFTQQESPNSPALQLLNTANNPINIKLQGSASWQQPHWGATVGLNFQNHYWDDSADPPRSISSYTTCDAQLRYNLAPFATGPLQNTLLELNAINVFNKSPPFLNNSVARLGYDQENADPYGRLVSIQVRKSW